MINEWKQILCRAHSMWAQYLALFCLLLPEIMFYVWQIDTNPRFWWLCAVGCVIYGILGRLIHQEIDQTTARSPVWILPVAVVLALFASGELAGVIDPGEASAQGVAEGGVGLGSDAEFLELAVPFIARWEGLRLEAYQDIVGVWTVCYGETKGVQPGDRYSQLQCDEMLAREILDYRARLHGHFAPDTIANRLPPPRDVAFVSLAYNVGVAATGGSTAVRRLNAGRITAACEALTWWNRAGGRVIRGLVNRREGEKALCLAGVA